MKSRVFAAVLFAALATVDARAGSIALLPTADTASLPTLTGRVVQFTGPVAAGDHSLFTQVVSEVRPDLVILDSPGGSISEALGIAERIRAGGYGTLVRRGRQCASACMVMFLSGAQKFVQADARLGLHAAQHDNGSGEVSVPGTAAMAAIFGQLGVPVDIVVRMASIGPGEMWWLDDRQQGALGVEVLELPPPQPAPTGTMPGAVPAMPPNSFPVPGL